MRTRRIGSLEVSVVGLGCNNFGRRLGPDAAMQVVHAALEAGVTFFDTADVYAQGQSEELLGRALGRRRTEVVIATKFGKPMGEQQRGARPDYVRQAAEASLRRLGTDYIDLYLLHEPDPAVPIEETIGALDELVRAGKVREIGCSNFSAGELRQAQQAAKPGAARFVCVENEYNLLQREPEREVLPECERLGLAFLPYYPLAAGLLTGKYRQGRPLPTATRLTQGGATSSFLSARNLALVESLSHFAESRGRTLLELAVSWLLTRPVVASVIAGAMSPEQVRANAAAAGWALTDEELAGIDAILSPAS